MKTEEQHIGFDAMINQCKGTLIKLCQFYTRGNPDDFPDLFQDILVNLWEQWPSFQGKSSVNTWVYSIARNTAVEYLRHRKKHINVSTTTPTVKSSTSTSTRKPPAKYPPSPESPNPPYGNVSIVQLKK